MENPGTTRCECGCGGELPAYDAKGRRRHFLRGHGRAAERDARCGRCAAIVRVKQWRLDRFGVVYCSRTCSAAARQRTERSACAACGREFERKASRSKGIEKFCSRACAARRPHRWLDRRVPGECNQCGKPLLIRRFKLATNRSFYCDRECRAAHISGENNPAYRSGLGRRPDYGPNWKRQRRAARLRDGDRCQECGKKPRGPRSLHVHHIRPYFHFAGDWRTANRLENLKVLCHSCHVAAEKQFPNRPAP